MKPLSTPRRKEREKTIEQIGSNPDISGTTEMYKMRALNSLVEDLEDSIRKHSRSTSLLSLVLIIATFVIALTGIGDIYYKVSAGGSRQQLSQTSG